MAETDVVSVQDALLRCVRDFGRLVGNDADRLRGLLTDALGGRARDVRDELEAVVTAAEQGVVPLIEQGGAVEATARLEGSGLAHDRAAYAVRTWSQALVPTLAPDDTVVDPDVTRRVPVPEMPLPPEDPPRGPRGPGRAANRKLIVGVVAAAVVVVGASGAFLAFGRGGDGDASPATTAGAVPTTTVPVDTTRAKVQVATTTTAVAVTTTPPTTAPPTTAPPTTAPAVVSVDVATVDPIGASNVVATFSGNLALAQCDLSSCLDVYAREYLIVRRNGEYFIGRANAFELPLARNGGTFTVSGGLTGDRTFQCNGVASETNIELTLTVNQVQVINGEARVTSFEITELMTSPAGGGCRGASRILQGVVTLQPA